ncbi:MAG: hypothetical protein IJS01_01845 [Lentisphaeria bacterium]|nr:hypothetical protein [Lentisphaeria bacterium]
MGKAAVTIPVYRREPEKSEKESLAQCVRVLGGKHPLILFAPGSLAIGPYLEIAPEARVERFGDGSFTSINGYSSLLLSRDFYARFSSFEHILIYQLDAWVFRDELDLWCEKKYDYIGAPFYLGKDVIIGNGGFSLRRVEAMKRVLTAPGGRMFSCGLLRRFFGTHWRNGDYLRAFGQLLRFAGIGNSREAFLERMCRDGSNEDMVFSYLNSRFVRNGLLMPDAQEAAHFALDAACEEFFERGGCRPPFGIHGWTKPDRMAFLKKHDFPGSPRL